MRKQSLSIISAFMIAAALLTGCGDTAPVPDTATPETTEASETEVSEAAPEETTDTTSVEASDDTDDASDTNMETATEEENKETPTEPEQPEETEETGYVKPEGAVNGYENPELVPKPSDYGKSIQNPKQIPRISCYGWDYEKHPILFGYTKGSGHFKIVKDGLTGDIYYPGMETPDGQLLLVDDKSTTALRKLRDKYGYEYDCQVTLEQAIEYFGEPDESSFSTEYWTD